MDRRDCKTVVYFFESDLSFRVHPLGDELCFAACRFTVTRITDVYLRREAGAPPGKDFRRYLQRLRAVKLHLEQDDRLLSLTE